MLALGPLAFAAPWLLLALAALPVVWWLLRVTPPAPRRLPFPAIRLLLGLVPREETPARTPWWLILLRTVLAALVIVALAHPLLNPRSTLPGGGPLILVVDDGWAAAHDWTQRQAAATDFLGEARREDRSVVLVTTAPHASGEAAPPLAPIRAADASAAIEALQPKPWPVDRKAALDRLKALPMSGATAAIWLSDGIDDPGAKPLAAYLGDGAGLRYLSADDPPRLLATGTSPADLSEQDLVVAVRSLPAPQPRPVTIRASAEDGALLARQSATIDANTDKATVRLKMPPELRNRMTRIEIEGDNSAGGVVLTDERWRRRPVGIAAPGSSAAQPLLSETYYLDKALQPFTEMRRGTAADLLKRDLAVLIYADTGPDSPAEEETVGKWVSAGGLLLRFAGPRLAEQSDHLLPVRLRRGGRTIGGALSWEKPAHLAPFADTSPFAGLAIPPDVTVSRQVLAEPDLDLNDKIWARLADGTPLVTAEKRGKGWIVLVHTTANAEWSNLALSGLFVEMLRRVVAMSQGVAAAGDQDLPPLETLDGFGRLERAPPTARPISGKDIATATASPLHPPGFYGTTDTRRALNLSTGIATLAPITDLPPQTVRAGFARSAETDFRAPLLTAALILALIDLLIAYALRGLLRRRAAPIAAAALALLIVPGVGRADDAFVVKATSELHLAYVKTGDDSIDSVSRAGLAGLGDTLNHRTAVETAAPLAVDIESDELIFFPLLYWPVTPDQPVPSPQAVERINRYLETGGTILFDTRDAAEQVPGPYGTGAQSRERLKRLVGAVKIPPLVPIPPDHVLTKSFYLLHDFPGREAGGQLWVEPSEDHVNDGVAAVIVGSNDYAGAWAVDAAGEPAYPCVPGGEAQRETAMRFGVNLVMYVLTGNYKSDQVHVPAILERLGQ
ncbi:MAG TPA: DUF4159 domain-containing protein [Stellaceae bacterium]|jgi:hypothetical protein|nr:DUF4159 domain-containing protein [Stellaceae bacterium]